MIQSLTYKELPKPARTGMVLKSHYVRIISEGNWIEWMYLCMYLNSGKALRDGMNCRSSADPWSESEWCCCTVWGNALPHVPYPPSSKQTSSGCSTAASAGWAGKRWWADCCCADDDKLCCWRLCGSNRFSCTQKLALEVSSISIVRRFFKIWSYHDAHIYTKILWNSIHHVLLPPGWKHIT